MSRKRRFESGLRYSGGAVQLKRGVDPTHVHPLLWVKLALADREHQVQTGMELVVTSLRRPPKPPSKHSPPADVYCTAADLRRHRLDALDRTEKFCRWLQVHLGLGVLLEPDWMLDEQIAARGGRDAIAPHIHTQLKVEPDDLGFGVTP